MDSCLMDRRHLRHLQENKKTKDRTGGTAAAVPRVHDTNLKREKMSREFLITLAGKEVAFRFHFGGTGMLFRNFERKTLPDGYAGSYLTADEKAIETYVDEHHCSMETAEYNCLLTETANFMTEQDCAMFHGVAFLYGEDAYILTAPSGTGKTTQFRNLRDMYGDRFRIINGDKPLLGPGPNGQIMVYPSPWNGKEQWGSTEHGPLRGLFLLEQGQENRLEVMDGGEAAVQILEQFIYTAPTRKSVHTVCRMADAMLRNFDLYHFLNKGDYASSSMLYAKIKGSGE